MRRWTGIEARNSFPDIAKIAIRSAAHWSSVAAIRLLCADERSRQKHDCCRNCFISFSAIGPLGKVRMQRGGQGKSTSAVLAS